MNVEWTETALNKLSQIKSDRFSEVETADYKEHLVLEIEEKVITTGTLFPSRNYKNRYYIKVKPYIISFKYFPKKEVYTIIAFQHEKQNKKY
ncbi:type II toxin-antitoxin system RelE/ParE family toxin [Evansella sp. AB-P1]|uniref:type II toxin-antitoxin system RelE/ParE family toxin n=1 Tax=Evansella sp. AB-P1 TaxID=3037653 RepID=UPI00241EB8A3|nr:type II toxin-antitoxin system RelE/ParE family toxin [Evansella sp. AB-P1]MDG5785992.1 type II toxin-antitoxin system RelE/ParE family toxin [Evansella sp. AB-P1]